MNDDPDRYIDRVELARWTQLVERLKTLGYTPWLSADELARYGDAVRNRDLMREFEQMADHIERLKIDHADIIKRAVWGF